MESERNVLEKTMYANEERGKGKGKDCLGISPTWCF